MLKIAAGNCHGGASGQHAGRRDYAALIRKMQKRRSEAKTAAYTDVGGAPARAISSTVGRLGALLDGAWMRGTEKAGSERTNTMRKQELARIVKAAKLIKAARLVKQAAFSKAALNLEGLKQTSNQLSPETHRALRMALLGAGGGAVIGGLANRKNRLRGAATGAALGGTALGGGRLALTGTVDMLRGRRARRALEQFGLDPNANLISNLRNKQDRLRNSSVVRGARDLADAGVATMDGALDKLMPALADARRRRHKQGSDPWPRGGIMNAGGKKTPPAVKPRPAAVGTRVPMPTVASAASQKTPGLALGRATPLPSGQPTQIAKR